MAEPKQEIKKLSKLLELKLTIPFYQRPYKWKSQNVTQLLDDIFEHVITKEKTYRIGSIILHEEVGVLNIVDGQQRLTTVSVLLKCLNELEDKLLLTQNYKHKISKDNIVYNYHIIKNWLTKISDKEKFKTQILERCEFVLFTVYDQDEAFQLFDSQNTRGKALEAYDLLKAFHLREMEFDTENDRTNAVKEWEKSIDNNTLKPLLGNHLFRIRKWAKNESQYNFTKNDIEEFKGVSLHKKQEFPYESSLRMLDGFVENAQNDKFLKNNQIAQSYPFSITMPIINGKRFFEYVAFYVNQIQDLFYNKNEDTFYKFYDQNCLDYPGSWRSGDEKVRNLYENILLQFIDKFGKRKDFESFYKAFYKAVYRIRCNNKSIRLETILNSNERKIIQEINDAITPDKLKKHQYKLYKIDKENNEMVKNADLIKKAINNNFNESNGE